MLAAVISDSPDMKRRQPPSCRPHTPSVATMLSQHQSVHLSEAVVKQPQGAQQDPLPRVAAVALVERHGGGHLVLQVVDPRRGGGVGAHEMVNVGCASVAELDGGEALVRLDGHAWVVARACAQL
eukprot:CAMPEP_0184382730 /NCGR_PEP_ID=MMETSP0007-20130409/6569_1 /TAXON_ID=97485 /ORGANISM="Prymnesium parvum, Strain Texoma1" /LENGTH=124 /DNA_ID=CAMNT_0026728885 /DNA_START=96 /DNA_END=471 /DNA_ORIENTATION=+